MIDGLIALLSGIPPVWRVFFLSMLPVAEMRVAFPLGLLWGLDMWTAFCWSIMGNFVPVIPLLLSLSWLMRRLGSFPFLAAPLNRLAVKNERNKDMVRRYGVVGLGVLVAIPLPGTGVWSGCLVAALLNIPFAPALLAITGGGLIAAAMILLAVSGVLAVAELQYGKWIAGTLLAAAIIIFLLRRRKK